MSNGNTNFIPSKIKCVGSLCPRNCINQDRCLKLGGSFINTICFMCGKDEAYQNYDCIKIIVCPQNSYLSGSQCICNSGLYMINGTCQSCPANSSWNGNSCACYLGLYLINGICQKCLSNSQWNGTSCICNPGYTIKSGVCEKNQPTCPTDSVWDGSKCVCADTFYLDNGVCVPCPKSTLGKGGECLCFFIWQYFSNGTCQNCPTSQRWNGSTWK